MTSQAVSKTDYRILIVDDDDADFFLAKESLEASQFAVNVSRASDGNEAINMLRSTKQLPDAILLDLNMPKISGHELLEQLKADEVLRRIPCVVLSTSDSEVDVRRSYRLKAKAHLKKPFDLAEYGEMVNTLCRDCWEFEQR